MDYIRPTMIHVSKSIFIICQELLLLPQTALCNSQDWTTQNSKIKQKPNKNLDKG